MSIERSRSTRTSSPEKATRLSALHRRETSGASSVEDGPSSGDPVNVALTSLRRVADRLRRLADLIDANGGIPSIVLRGEADIVDRRCEVLESSDGGVGNHRHAKTGSKAGSIPAEAGCSTATSFEREEVRKTAIQSSAGVVTGPSDPIEPSNMGTTLVAPFHPDTGGSGTVGTTEQPDDADDNRFLLVDRSF